MHRHVATDKGAMVVWREWPAGWTSCQCCFRSQKCSRKYRGRRCCYRAWGMTWRASFSSVDIIAAKSLARLLGKSSGVFGCIPSLDSHLNFKVTLLQDNAIPFELAEASNTQEPTQRLGHKQVTGAMHAISGGPSWYLWCWVLCCCSWKATASIHLWQSQKCDFGW